MVDKRVVRIGGASGFWGDSSVGAPQLVNALGHYAGESEIGASLLAETSRRHLTRHAPGKWALAGIAQRT